MAIQARLKKAWDKLVFRIPRQLPKGMTELENFTNSILDTYDIPNNDSMHNAISSMIMHTGQTTSHLSKHYFAKALMNAMAKEVAFTKLDQLREARKQREAALKEEAAGEPQTA